MSTPPDADFKAGHPPAVKAGGMRVARHRKTSEQEEKVDPATIAAEQEEFGTELTKLDKHNQQILIAGVVTKGDRDFSTQAVKQFHEKPFPCKEKRPIQMAYPIQQPR